MRPFEIALTAALFLSFIGWLFPSFLKSIPAGYRTLVVASILFAALHIVVEQGRWQLVPIYVLLPLLLLALFLVVELDRAPLVQPGWIKGILATLIILALIPAVLLPIIFPILRLPKPTGPYTVGTRAYAHVDTSRQEIYGPPPFGEREFVSQVWYPASPSAQHKTGDFLPQAEITTRTLAERLGLPAFVLDHLTLLKTYSYVDAPIVAGETYPVLIFSHGHNGIRFQSTTLMEDLASHGYIVIALTHTYGSAITIFPDNRIIFHDPDTLIGEGDELRESGLKLGDQWVDDIEYILDGLESGTYPFNEGLNLDQIGIFGHSTGAGVAMRTCYEDQPRCKAVIGLDAWFGPVPDEIIENGIDVPAYFLMSEIWPKPENIERIETFMDATPGSQWATILKTGHYDFTDIPFLSPLTFRLGLSGQIDAYRGQEINREYVRGFFDQHLKGDEADYLYAGSDRFNEVIFRE